MQIIPLSEGTFTIDKSKQFVPFDEDTDDLQDRPTGSLLVEVQPFVVITSRDILLLDAGLGFTNARGVLQLHQNLVDHGINPLDITKVLMTHLHKDHAGGLTIKDAITGQYRPAFPQAVHYIREEEWDFAFQKGFPSFIPEELNALRQLEKVEWLQGDGVIDEYIRYEWTGAHSPFHQVFHIAEGNENIFFGGDDAPQLQQMKSRFVAKYDHDGKKAMEFRQEWWSKGNAEGWTFLFYHDVRNPTFKR